VDKTGRRAFPPFTALKIAHCSGHAGYYLMHICANGLGTDTWDEPLEDAIGQAEFEFGMRPDEWTEINEPW